MHNLHRPEPSGPEFRYEGPIQDAPQAQKTHPLAFPELRILAQAAYNLAMEKMSGALAAAECSAQVGALFYPQNLPNDQRRLGGMLIISILSLDERLRRKEIFGGPAFHIDTRRLLVADVIASAHLQVQDLGHLHKKVEEWFPKDTFDKEGGQSAVGVAGTPSADFSALDAPMTRPEREAALRKNLGLKQSKPFKLEEVLGSVEAEEFGFAYANLEAVIFGVSFIMEAEGTGSRNQPAIALRNAFHSFNGHLKPILKGELSLKGEG